MKVRWNRPSAVVLAAAATILSASILSALPTRVIRRGAPVRNEPLSTAGATSGAAVSYSVEVPIVTRVVGTAQFKTAIDISNNTSSGTAAVRVVAKLQYSC